MVRIYGRTKLNLTQALAKSNKQYFASSASSWDTKSSDYYAHLFVLGEKAGPRYPRRAFRTFPSEPPKNGGMAC